MRFNQSTYQREAQMAAKDWESDFRYAAIQQSLAYFQDDVPDDIYDVQRSFCLPIAARPVIGFSPGKLILVFLVLGFALLGAGVFVLSLAKDGGTFLECGIFYVIGPMCSLTGMLCFFAPVLFSKQIAAWFIGPRYRELKTRAGEAKLLITEVSDGDLSKQKLSIDGDDYVAVFFDESNRRILIEGISARYQIRCEDIELVEPFVFLNYLGARINCRVGEAQLSFAVASVSMLFELTRQVPVLFFLKRWVKNPIFTATQRTLSVRQPIAELSR
ncbi:MAG: hypothetical protein R3C05_15055 [Pirellulaceae bacterium]